VELGFEQNFLVDIQSHLNRLQEIEKNINTYKVEVEKITSSSQSKLENLRSILDTIDENKQVAEDIQKQANNLQVTTVSLLQEINYLGGSEKLIERLKQLQEIAKHLENLEPKIKSSVDGFLNNYIPDFEEGKFQIEQWRKEVYIKTVQTLEQINTTHKTVDELSKKINQDYYYYKNILKELQEKKSELSLILSTITELTQSFGGENIFIKVTKKITNLDNFLATEKYALVDFREQLSKSLHHELQNSLSKEIEKLETKYMQEINSLQKENQRLKKSSFRLIS
jgi:DNA repair exonuclease SbcCD ATPase subunit